MPTFKEWLYRWLPIVFGCHCRDDRSFHYHGEKFPICARCTGELAGILVSVIISFFFLPSIKVCVALMVPMLADGFIQLKTSYESTNIRRLITGFLFGYSLFSLFAISTVATFSFGYSLAQ